MGRPINYSRIAEIGNAYLEIGDPRETARRLGVGPNVVLRALDNSRDPRVSAMLERAAANDRAIRGRERLGKRVVERAGTCARCSLSLFVGEDHVCAWMPVEGYARAPTNLSDAADTHGSGVLGVIRGKVFGPEAPGWRKKYVRHKRAGRC